MKNNTVKAERLARSSTMRAAAARKKSNPCVWAKEYLEMSENLRAILLRLSESLSNTDETTAPAPEHFGKGAYRLEAAGKLAGYISKLADTELYWREYIKRAENSEEHDASETFTPLELDALERYLRRVRPGAFSKD